MTCAIHQVKPVTHEQVFFDKFWLGKFYLLVCKEEFVNFFLDKCTCSKASMIAFEQVKNCHIAEFAHLYGSTRKTCQRKYGNCGRTAVLLLWCLEYCIEVNGKNCENVPRLLLLVLALNCLQNLETDFVFALPEGEPTTSDSYVSS